MHMHAVSNLSHHVNIKPTNLQKLIVFYSYSINKMVQYYYYEVEMDLKLFYSATL